MVYLYKRRWPLYFTLDNGMNVDNKIFIFLNGTPYNNQALELKKGKKTKIILEKIINPITSLPYTRSQATNITVQIERLNQSSSENVTGSIYYEKGNIPNEKVSLSKDLAGFNRTSEDVGNSWSSEGFYTVNFYKGIPLF